MNKAKQRIVLFLFAVAIVCFGYAIRFISGASVKAYAETLSAFTMEESAQIRKYTPTGIRFTTNVDEGTKAKVCEWTDVTYGTLVIPTHLLTGELTTETQDVLKIVTEKWQDEAKTRYTGVVAGTPTSDLPESWYNTPFTARGFVTGKKDGVAVTHYTQNTVTRSIGYVAGVLMETDETSANSAVIRNIASKTSVGFTLPETLTLSSKTSQTTQVHFTLGNMPVPAGLLPVEYAFGDGQIATAENGVIYGLQAGTTSVTATYTLLGKTYTATTRLTVETERSEVVDAGEITLDSTSIFGAGVTIASVRHGAKEIATHGTFSLPSGRYALTVVGSNAQTKMIEVIVPTKVITTVDEFKEVFTGATLSCGYYVLGGDIDANGAMLGASDKGWDKNAGLSGGAVFDGRGYTLSNFTVTSENGLFGTLGYSTVKNVRFTDVALQGGTALLAYNAYGATVTDVEVEYVDIGGTASGLLINGQTGEGSTFTNITLRAVGLTVPNALGDKVNLTERTAENCAGVVFENVEIIAKSITKFGTGGCGADVTDDILELPSGVTFTVQDIATVDVLEEVVAENGVLTLSHDWVQGTVEVDGKAYTVQTAGECTAKIDGLTLGKVHTVTCITDRGNVRFTNVLAVTKAIQTADDLDVLNAHSESVEGYYILTGDIDATGKTVGCSSYSWGAGFSGILDGRGHTVYGLTITGHGLFTRIAGGTVKNIRFEDVALNGGTLFAYMTTSSVHINGVEISVATLTPIVGEDNGILIARQIEAIEPSYIGDLALEVVKGVCVPNVFGQIKTDNLTIKNVAITATALEILATDDAGESVTALAGVTVTKYQEDITIDAPFTATDGKVTLAHEWFTVGKEVTVDGTAYTVEEKGVLTVLIDELQAGERYTLVCTTADGVLRFTNVQAGASSTVEQLTVETFVAVENGDAMLTLTHESFISGTHVQVTWNGAVKTTVLGAGSLTLALADFGVTAFGKYSVTVEWGTYRIAFTEVWNVTKVLTCKADIRLLSVWTEKKNAGYYVLNGDIECGFGDALGAESTSWNGNQGFIGTLDGRGFTISQLHVQANGLFGGLGTGSVITNIRFEDCIVDNGGALFARKIYGGRIENVDIALEYNNAGNTYGILAKDNMQDVALKDVTIRVHGEQGGTICTVFGTNVYRITVENVSIENLASTPVYGYSDSGTTTLVKPDGLVIVLYANT